MTVSSNFELVEIPTGGTDLERFDWQEVWYPIHYVDDLDLSKPNSFTLLNQDLVIWWDQKTAEWRVFTDQCPHRLARLSEGRINEQGLLECPYHGWAFAGDGNCEFIPQQVAGGKAEISKRACVKSLPTKIRQGLLFVYPGNPENADRVKIPIIEPLEETPSEWICLNTFRDLPYDALTLMENVIDASHVPYTHHGTVGNRRNASPVELEIVTSGRQGFTGTWAEGPRKGTLGKQDTTFIAPNLMWHDLTSKQFGRTLTVVYATPIRKGECRLFARFPFKFASKIPALFIKLTPRWYSHLNQNTILEDDQIFLHHQERYLENLGSTENFSRAFYLPTKADTFVFELRQWVNQYQAEPFPNVSLPASLATKELLERYHSHTIKCKSCAGALKIIQGWHTGLGIWLVLILLLSPLIALISESVILNSLITVIGLISGAIWLYLGQLKQKFYEGPSIPSRNLQK